MLVDLPTQLLWVGVEFIQSARIQLTGHADPPAFAGALLRALDMLALFATRAGPGVAERPRHVVHGVGRQFRALPVQCPKLAEVQPNPVGEWL